MVAVPAATPVMSPEDVFTVAIPVLLDDHAPPAPPLLKKVVLPPTQIFCAPPTVPALGGELTVTERVAVALAHPPVPVTV